MAKFEVKDGILYVKDDSESTFKFLRDSIFSVSFKREDPRIRVNGESIFIVKEDERFSLCDLAVFLQQETAMARLKKFDPVEVKPEPWTPKVGEIVFWCSMEEDCAALIVGLDGEDFMVVSSVFDSSSEYEIGVFIATLGRLHEITEKQRAEFADEIALFEAIKKVKRL